MINSLALFLGGVIFIDMALTVCRVSLMNARSAHLIMLRETQPVRVDRTLALIERPRLRTGLRSAIVFTHMSFACLVWTLVNPWLSTVIAAQDVYAVSFVCVLIAALLLNILEYLLEGKILIDAEKWALSFTPLGSLFDVIFSPVSALALLLLGYDGQQVKTPEMTEDDLKNWVEAGQPQGSLEPEERKMIYSIFHFGETLAREIMVPRIYVLALDIHATLQETIAAFSNSGHSRVPIFEGTIDNIIGFLYAKDLLDVQHEGEEELATMRELLRPAYFVPEAKKVDDLLAEMQTRRVHIAVVVDEYGGVAGLVSLEDIMEEIIGEIKDEYDQSEEMPYQQVGEGEYIFQGRIDLGAFNEVMGSHLEKESTDTLGGFIYSEIGKVPTGGESIKTEGVTLTVEQVIGRRIRKVRARKTLPPQEMEKDDANAE